MPPRRVEVLDGVGKKHFVAYVWHKIRSREPRGHSSGYTGCMPPRRCAACVLLPLPTSASALQGVQNLERYHIEGKEDLQGHPEQISIA